MKAATLFLFNVIRNLCLILVFGLVLLSLFLHFNPDAEKRFTAMTDPEYYEFRYGESVAFEESDVRSVETDRIMSVSSFDARESDSKKREIESPTVSNYPIVVGYSESNPNWKKHAFKRLGGGNIFLRSSQLMYAKTEDGSRHLLLRATNGEKYRTNSTLKNMEHILRTDSTTTFFKTKDALINCNYVQSIYSMQGYGSSRHYYVMMEDRDSVKISKDKYSELHTQITGLEPDY